VYSRQKPFVPPLQTQLAADKHITALRIGVDREISRVTQHERGIQWIAERALRYSALTKGHRWRPILFMALIESMRGSYKAYLGTAAGLELLHTGTLIIDDLPCVDNATLRRGKPCCHVRFGADVAIYASHLAFDMAETLILRDAPRDLKENILQDIKALKKTLIAGQSIERALCARELPVTFQNVKSHYYMRSGALFSFSVRLAAMVSGVKPQGVQLVGQFGEEVGVAYQIADDIADMSGDSSQIGKQTQMDVGKINFPRHYGKPSAIQNLRVHSRHAIALLDSLYSKNVLTTDTRPLLTSILKHLHQHY
jgi:geranylgeranyl pyrophosphate synthase